MHTSTRLYDYLDASGIRYDTLEHPPSASSLETATVAKVPAHSLAKGVMLEDHEGRHLMAVLPASHKLSVQELGRQLGLQLHLLDEAQVYPLFADCDPGAVPALGQAYHLNAIYDQTLCDQQDVYLEAGDHKTLVHLRGSEFSKLMDSAKQGHFSHRSFN